MRKKTIFFCFALVICTTLSGCVKKEIRSNNTETNTAETNTTLAVSSDTKETAAEYAANTRQPSNKNLYIDTAEPKEIPELGYRNISGLSYGMNNYICHDDTLILGTDIYKKEGETYVKQDSTLNTIFHVDEHSGMQCRQYQNLVITVSKDSASFFIYDMDTQENNRYYSVASDMQIGPFWYVCDGCIYYSEWARQDIFGKARTLKKLSLSDGSITDVYQPVIGENKDCFLGDARMRNDGTMAYEIYDKEGKHKEYWIAQANENGEWNGKKLWETTKWEYSYILDFNQYGLIVLGESNSSGDYEIVAIKDNGETQRLDTRLIEGEYLFTDNGYFSSNAAEPENAVRDTENALAGQLPQCKSDSVSFYDYAGNLKGTYPMGNKALLEQGYYLQKLTFNRGKLAGFYVQRDTGELYIGEFTVYH